MVCPECSNILFVYRQHYARHFESNKVKEAMEGRVVARISGRDYRLPRDGERYELFESEPQRQLAAFKVVTTYPFVAETNSSYLGSFYTKNDWFYVRNHAPVPQLNERDHVVSFGGLTETKRRATVEQMSQEFEKVSVVGVLQCAGNRGGEGEGKTQFEREIGSGLIGNAKWSGFRLWDVLEKYQMLPSGKSTEDLHLEIYGVDGYYTSVPLKQINEDALIATHMNGEKLPADHGYPVRIYIPGIIGARDVKWVSSVKVSDSEVRSPWNEYYYKSVEKQSLLEMPIQSVILESDPRPKDNVLGLSGVAWAGHSGRQIENVQVSCDNGSSWTDAELTQHDFKDHAKKHWSWTRWAAALDLEQCEKNKEAIAMVRAHDGIQQQPEQWEAKIPYLNNSIQKYKWKD